MRRPVIVCAVLCLLLVSVLLPAGIAMAKGHHRNHCQNYHRHHHRCCQQVEPTGMYVCDYYLDKDDNGNILITVEIREAVDPDGNHFAPASSSDPVVPWAWVNLTIRDDEQEIVFEDDACCVGDGTVEFNIGMLDGIWYRAVVTELEEQNYVWWNQYPDPGFVLRGDNFGVFRLDTMQIY